MGTMAVNWKERDGLTSLWGGVRSEGKNRTSLGNKVHPCPTYSPAHNRARHFRLGVSTATAPLQHVLNAGDRNRYRGREDLIRFRTDSAYVFPGSRFLQRVGIESGRLLLTVGFVVGGGFTGNVGT